jgi:hypothetical protein
MNGNVRFAVRVWTTSGPAVEIVFDAVVEFPAAL